MLLLEVFLIGRLQCFFGERQTPILAAIQERSTRAMSDFDPSGNHGFPSGLTSPDAVIVIFAAVADEILIEFSDMLDHRPGDPDTRETDWQSIEFSATNADSIDLYHAPFPAGRKALKWVSYAAIDQGRQNPATRILAGNVGQPVKETFLYAYHVVIAENHIPVGEEQDAPVGIAREHEFARKVVNVFD